MNRILLIITVLVAQAIPTTAESREKDLDRWFDRSLIPHVRQQLLIHPRFKGETVMFVVMEDKQPTPVSNALAISLRDRLLDASINTPGVAVGWRQGQRAGTPAARSLDCSRDEVHYYIGIEVTQKLDSNYQVSVRALDLEDSSWVAGFGKQWDGQLRAIQRQAMRQSRIDKTFQGSREVPFSLAETDLLAARLAHELSCSLLREAGDDYLLSSSAGGAGLAGTPELVGNNLAGFSAAGIAPAGVAGNAELQGKAHRIDGPLFQYWLTIKPTDPEVDLATLSASAYVLLPDYGPEPADDVAEPAPQPLPDAPSRHLPASVSMPNAGDNALIGPLRIAAAAGGGDCRLAAGGPRQRACSLLQAESNRDSIVFVLAHQANRGLVRLGGTECRSRTAARIATAGELMRFPIPEMWTGGNAAETFDWLLEPPVDTYYAVAIADARTARNVANHLDRLPMRCSDAVRAGLEGHELRAWLDEFAMLAARSAQDFDWRALQVREVF